MIKLIHLGGIIAANLTPIAPITARIAGVTDPITDIKNSIKNRFFSSGSSQGAQIFDGLIDRLTTAQKNSLIYAYQRDWNNTDSVVNWLYSNRHSLNLNQGERNVILGMYTKKGLEERQRQLQNEVSSANYVYNYNPSIQSWLSTMQNGFQTDARNLAHELDNPDTNNGVAIQNIMNSIDRNHFTNMDKIDYLRRILSDPRFANNIHNIDADFLRRLENIASNHNWNVYEIDGDLLDSLAESSGFWSRALQLSSMNRIMMGVIGAISLFVSILLSLLLSRMRKVNNSKSIKKLIISLLSIFSILAVGLAIFAGIGGA